MQQYPRPIKHCGAEDTLIEESTFGLQAECLWCQTLETKQLDFDVLVQRME